MLPQESSPVGVEPESDSALARGYRATTSDAVALGVNHRSCLPGATSSESGRAVPARRAPAFVLAGTASEGSGWEASPAQGAKVTLPPPPLPWPARVPAATAMLPAAATQPAATVRSRRVVWVDLLRLIASFQMIHGHTLDALMAGSLREGEAFARWSWARGLVSVSFMVAAGVAFSLSTLDRYAEHRGDAALKRRRLWRFGWLVALGYLLHFPAGLFSGDSVAAAEAWTAFQMVDVLQCIGVSLLLLQLLTWTLPSRTQVVWVATGLSGMFLFGAPFADAVPVTGLLPRVVANYFTHTGGSLFPLFPWAGFVLFGVALAAFVLPAGAATAHRVALTRLAVAACGVLLLAYGLRQFTPGDSTITFQARTWFALSKLGWVLVVLTLLAGFGTRVRQLPKALRILSGESLSLYVFHLLVLYGAGVGLSRVLGRTLPLREAIVVAVLMVIGSALVSLAWHRVKTAWRSRRAADARE